MKLKEGLSELGWMAQMLMVYRRENAVLDRQEINRLKEAAGILSVWTSANAMKSLSQHPYLNQPKQIAQNVLHT